MYSSDEDAFSELFAGEGSAWLADTESTSTRRIASREGPSRENRSAKRREKPSEWVLWPDESRMETAVGASESQAASMDCIVVAHSVVWVVGIVGMRGEVSAGGEGERGGGGVCAYLCPQCEPQTDAEDPQTPAARSHARGSPRRPKPQRPRAVTGSSARIATPFSSTLRTLLLPTLTRGEIHLYREMQ
ncbi:hypothetical protein BC830DRAFT_567917 [Chytriomyces sp. MP71]|nr:hypothetical protein BC830DRAFT_567917 [Chytriomyces sp. MP71]